ncbi:hypothetical protein [Lactobacillus bombicola]|uniref:XRE family transcriptional regulator n=1 Tax=Lactobacillus bombicola TaxID=1505723 RepID=A0ABX9LXQ8_9LACO|nr:hypothetical protein [Lactobacillus bombicola]RHW48866.1 hypothetical protein DS833_06705 [Lactobacillus bombicola]RHW53588.1 hypothetical protein DS834_01235 [Lactobacillus bombicola]
MVEQISKKKAKELRTKFKVAITEHHTTQRKLAKYCDTNEAQFSRAIAGEKGNRADEIRKTAADFLEIEI